MNGHSALGEDLRKALTFLRDEALDGDCQLAGAPSSPRLALGRSSGRAVLHLGLVATTQAKYEPRNSLQPAGWGPWMPHPVLCERSTKAEEFVVTTPDNAARALKRAVPVCLAVTMAPGSQVRIRPSVAAAPHLAFSSASHLRVPSHLVSWALGCSCGLPDLVDSATEAQSRHKRTPVQRQPEHV